MGTAMFYHLTHRPLEATLPSLVRKARSAGWRVAIRSRDLSTLGRLDNLLWQGDGFLPHGIAGGEHDAFQPVLLTSGEISNGAECVLALDGIPVEASEVEVAERYCIIFDGAQDDAVETARQQWRALKEAGIKAEYWSEDGGGWVKKA